MTILIKNVLLNGKKKNVLIEKNAISKISSKPIRGSKRDRIIDGKNKALFLPFYNMHTHSAMTLLRGFGDDLPLNSWLNEKIWPQEKKLKEKDVYLGSKLACIEMIKSGTVFFNDMYWNWNATSKAADEFKMRLSNSTAIMDFFDKKELEVHIKRVEKEFKNSKKYSDRIIFSLGPHSIYTLSKEGLEWVKNFAIEKNLKVHIHLSETKKEVSDCLNSKTVTPVQFLNSIDFLNENTCAAHCVWVNKKDISILKKNNVTIITNTASNMKLSSGAFEYDAINSAGLNITLGTDGVASNNNLDMFEAMKCASLLAKHESKNPCALPVKEAYDLATINAAKFFNINIGLEEGKIADLMLIDLTKPELLPTHNLLSNLVYSANGSCVDTLICDGNILMKDRKIKGEKKIIEKFDKAAKNFVK